MTSIYAGVTALMLLAVGIDKNTVVPPTGAPTAKIAVIGCYADRSIEPKFFVFMNSGWQPLQATRFSNDNQGFYRFNLFTKPGSYMIRVETSGYCHSITRISLIEGHVRNITLLLSRALFLDERDFALAGSLPSGGIRVFLVSHGKVIYTGIVDGQAYYFDYLQRGDYVLRVAIEDEQYVDIPVSVDKLLTIRNVVASDFRGEPHNGKGTF
jgi:hypothetical protein